LTKIRTKHTLGSGLQAQVHHTSIVRFSLTTTISLTKIYEFIAIVLLQEKCRLAVIRKNNFCYRVVVDVGLGTPIGNREVYWMMVVVKVCGKRNDEDPITTLRRPRRL